MKLATKTDDYSLYQITQEQAIERISLSGFRYIDYSFGLDYKERKGIYSNDYKSYIKSIKNATEKYNVKLVQAHSPMGKPLLDKDGVFLKDTMRCIDACAEWGIENLVVHSGYREGLSKEQTIEENKNFFIPLLERAEKFGVNILVENFNKRCVSGLYWIDNAKDLLSMIECVNHPLFHAVWDVGHANMQDYLQDEEIALLGKHVYALHIHDNDKKGDTHLVPFLGSLDITSVMKGLKNIGFNGYFTFEVNSSFALANSDKIYQIEKGQTLPPIEEKDAFLRYLFTLGKSILEKYNCFSE
jgi:sugar phosphate isomerase/epimerase